MIQLIQLASSLRAQMQAGLSRTDVLRPLAWIIGVFLTAICVLAAAKAPNWLLIVCASGFVILTLLYAAAYIFCLFQDRDALRSERYSLHKMAIEHGLFGDSTTGLFDVDIDSPKLIGPSASETKAGDQ